MSECGCSCCHEHEHDKNRYLLPRLGLALVLLVAAMRLGLVPLYLAAYIIAGYDVIIAAAKGIMKGGIFAEAFLMTVATLGAFAIGEYVEGVAVMIFYGFGEFISDKAVDKSSDSINALIRLRPDRARLVKNGTKLETEPCEINVGDIISVMPGERAPLDGVLLSDGAIADTSAITGESIPRSIAKGGEVLAGFIVLKSEILLRVTHSMEDSSTERIFRLVTEARQRKSRSEKFISRFAAVYTPAVVISAVLLAVIPPLLGAGTLSDWVHRSLVFLVASCPCALVISVPLTYFAGMGLASRNWILFKGSVYMEQLARLTSAAFDKTGTLTCGELGISHIEPCTVSENELLRLAAAAEKPSEHPIGKAIAAKYTSAPEPESFEELTGGIRAVVEGKAITAGNSALTGVESHMNGTAVHVLSDGVYIGSIYLSDTLRNGSREAIDSLHSLKISTAIISGDSRHAAETAARELGIEEVHAEVLPSEKLGIIKSMNGVRAFVGDGINDSPALSGADVGIAMGAMGREAAMEAADVVIMDDDLRRIPLAVRIARKVRRTVVLNVGFVLAVKAAVLILGALGIADMRLGVFADVGAMLIAVAIAVVRCRRV